MTEQASAPRVLQVYLGPNVGGMPILALELTRWLSERVPCALLVARGSGMVEPARARGLECIEVRLWSRHLDVPAALAVRSAVVAGSYDVLHHHGSSEMGLLSLALTGLDRVALVNHKHIHIRSYKRSWYYRKIYARCDAVIVPGQSVVENVLEHYPLERSRIHLMANAIDLASFSREGPTGVLSGLVAREGRPFVVTVGRVAQGKGIERFVDAADEVVRRCRAAGTSPPRFFVVGGGERAFVDQMAARRRFPDDVVFTGPVADVAAVLREADLFVVLSAGETGPLSLLEAMAVQVPALGLEVPGVRDRLAPYREECLLPADVSTEALATRIQARLTDGRRPSYDMTPYDAGHYVDRLLALYEDLLRRRRPPGRPLVARSAGG